MTGRRHDLYRGLGSAENRAETVVRRLRTRAGLTGEPIVLAYRGYGSPDRVRVAGRVLERRRSQAAAVDDPWWRNAVAVLRRVASRELPDVAVTVRLAGAQATVVTDVDGYWHAELAGPDLSAGWHPVTVEAQPPGSGPAAVATGEVLVVPGDAPIALVSDLDDTVIHSGITNLLSATRTLLFRNAATRTPWAGVAELYRALVDGTTAGATPTPVFYLSTSPWNLYDLLVEFLDGRGLPRGPLMLMDWGLSGRGLLRGEKNHHKRERLDELVRDFPSMRLLLVGDSGERDAEVFRDVARAHPGRVLGAVVRNVTLTIDPHARGVRDALAELDGLGVPNTLCQDATSAAVFAHEHGWLDEAAIVAVRHAQEADLRRP